jgi:hypothetical protein
MPTCGLVITLQPDAAACAEPPAALRDCAQLTLGAREGQWLAAVLETHDDTEARDRHDWLLAQPGIAFVDVVSVGFDDPVGAAHQSGEMEGWSDAVLSPTTPSRSGHNSISPPLHHSSAPASP